MKLLLPTNLRTRLTLWYVGVLALLLLIYATLVFAFQYAVLTRQLFHDEVQDVVTVEGLLHFDSYGNLRLQQDYYSRPQSHLLIDRMMEVRDSSGSVLFRSPTLRGMSLDGPNRPGEGDTSFNERIVRLSDGSRVFLVSHLHTMQGHTLLIRLGYSLAPLRARMLQFLLLLVIAIPLALALAGLAGQMIALRALRPLRQMADAAEGITIHNLANRLEVNAADELGHIAKSFNHLLDRLEQAFAQLQRFTADAAHELRTPLASLRAVGEVALEEGRTSEDYRDALGSILEETARLNESIEGLLLLARAEATQPQNQTSSVCVTEVVDEVLQLLDVVIIERQIEVIKEREERARGVSVQADRSLLRNAIVNILHNALKFSPNKSKLCINYSRTENPNSRILIAIQDEGPGIAPGEHRRVFERFFTSGSLDTVSKSGSGLGLSIAKLIIDRIGGRIYFDEMIKGGAMCIIEIPLSNK